MPWTQYKLGVKRFEFTDPGNAGTSAREVSDNFVRLTDLVEAAADGSIDLLDYQRRDERDEPGGYPTLDAFGRIDSAVVPPLAIARITGLTSALADKATIAQLNAEIVTLNATISTLQSQLDSQRQYVHQQSTPAATWDIMHNLGRYPAVTIMDSSGDVFEGDVKHYGPNRVALMFSGAFSGKAILT